MNSVADIIDSINGGNSGGGSEKEERNKPNAPSLKTGMTPVKFNEATVNKKGEIVKTTKEDKDWYSYENKKRKMEAYGYGYQDMHIK